MADHLRDQIMAAMVTALTGLTTTGVNVYPDRDETEEPVQTGELPCLVVNQGPNETAEALTTAFPRTLQCVFDIDVAAYARRPPVFKDRRQVANRIAKEAQIAIGNNPRLGGVCDSVTLVQTDLDLASEAEKPMAMARLRFQAVYFCKENAPDVAPN